MAKKQQKAGTLYIRDVPQTTLDGLKRASKLSGRSREKEARQVLIDAMLPRITKTFSTGEHTHTIHIPEPQTVTV